MSTKKKQQTYVTIRDSADMAALHQRSNVPVKTLCTMFPMYSQRSIYRHAKRKLGQTIEDKRKHNPGRPTKLTAHDRRAILRAVKNLRRTEGYNFTTKRIKVEAGLVGVVSNRTIQRVLKAHGFGYRQSRKKGMMSAQDMKKRVLFCRRIERKKLGLDFWTKGISFYLDGKGFQYKTNPHDQARAPKARAWRTASEGLKFTAKGKKEGQSMVNFMCAIAHNSGVVMCEQYHGSINGQKMVDIVDGHFDQAFRKTSNPRGRRFLMDNCPRQVSRAAMKAYARAKAKVFRIPARSPDINPIENFFHQMTCKLEQDAFENHITRETKEEFAERIKKTMAEFPVNRINKLIESMPRRVRLVIKAKGRRIRY